MHIGILWEMSFFFLIINLKRIFVSTLYLLHQVYLGKEICGVTDGAMNWPSESVVMNNL